MRVRAGRETEAVGRLRRREPWHEREEHCGDQRERHADPQDAGVDGEIDRPHRKPRRIARQDEHHRLGERNAEQRAGPAQQHAFGKEGAAQRRASCTERGTNRELAFAPDRPRQNQVGDVGAGNHKDQRRRRQQHEEHSARRRHNLVAQPPGLDAESGVLLVRLRVRADDRCVHGLELGFRRLESAPGARRPKSSVIRCTRPVTIVASR